MWKIFKLLLLFTLTVSVFCYATSRTHHELKIPQDLDGEVVLKISDSDLEDRVNDLFKIPLQLLPREICLENNNRVYSDDVEVSRNEEFPDVGSMELYVEKEGGQLIKKISIPVGAIQCRPIDPNLLEGATTTANYTQAAFIKFETNSDGSIKVIGGHQTDTGFQINMKVDVSQTHLWVDLSLIGRLLLFAFSFFGVSAAILALVELTKRIIVFVTEGQFLALTRFWYNGRKGVDDRKRERDVSRLLIALAVGFFTSAFVWCLFIYIPTGAITENALSNLLMSFIQGFVGFIAIMGALVLFQLQEIQHRQTDAGDKNVDVSSAREIRRGLTWLTCLCIIGLICAMLLLLITSLVNTKLVATSILGFSVTTLSYAGWLVKRTVFWR